MKDIVERLRDTDDLVGCYADHHVRAMTEAADEITRLRAENERLRARGDALNDELGRCMLDRDEYSENARLRERVAELEGVLSEALWRHDDPEQCYIMHPMNAQRAAQALKGGA